MITLELAAAVIVVTYVAARAHLDPAPRRFLVRLALLVGASWIGEETAIRAYRFYAYNPEWTVFVGHVPLAVILIWPGVIHSAWDTARYLLESPSRRALIPLVGGAFVVADASLIEPVSVQAGLWWWNEPGLFAVPPIGILGWGFHAAICMVVLEHNRRAERAPWADGAMLLLAPLGTHALLLASWWGLFRWINTTIAPWPVVAAAWALSIALAWTALRSRAKERIPAREMWTRVPAALFFLALLVLYGRRQPALIAYAFAFAPPYIALTRWPRASEAPS